MIDRESTKIDVNPLTIKISPGASDNALEARSKMVRAILMNPKDNVATLLSDVEEGGTVSVTSTSGDVQSEVKARQPIPFGHKISIGEIAQGDKIVKYGEVIGEAMHFIARGDHVHIQNVRSITWRKFG
jgi:altronate dehydratase small subunit